MTIITLPPDIEGPILEEARRRGTTAEQLALESLRRLFATEQPDGESPTGETLFDFLADHVGTVSGSSEPLSENCGERFADVVAEKQTRGNL